MPVHETAVRAWIGALRVLPQAVTGELVTGPRSARRFCALGAGCVAAIAHGEPLEVRDEHDGPDFVVVDGSDRTALDVLADWVGVDVAWLPVDPDTLPAGLAAAVRGVVSEAVRRWPLLLELERLDMVDLARPHLWLLSDRGASFGLIADLLRVVLDVDAHLVGDADSSWLSDAALHDLQVAAELDPWGPALTVPPRPKAGDSRLRQHTPHPRKEVGRV